MASDLLKDRSIYEQLCKDYLNLKTIANSSCSQPEGIQKCKVLVKCEINSARKLCRIKTLDDLLLLLETRNNLSMIKVEPLIKFDVAIDDVQFTKYLERYQFLLSQHSASVRRFYLEDLRHRDRLSMLEKEIERVKLEGHEPYSSQPYEPLKCSPNSGTKSDKYIQCRQNIFDLLSTEIGRDWNKLGIRLQLSPSVLETIEERHRKNLMARINDILEEAERAHSDGQEFVALLGEALIGVRRRDLQRKVEKMLS